MSLGQLRDMCSVAIPSVIPYSKTSYVPGTGEKWTGSVCAGAVGRVGCTAFDQMAGELEA